MTEPIILKKECIFPTEYISKLNDYEIKVTNIHGVEDPAIDNERLKYSIIGDIQIKSTLTPKLQEQILGVEDFSVFVNEINFSKKGSLYVKIQTAHLNATGEVIEPLPSNSEGGLNKLLNPIEKDFEKYQKAYQELIINNFLKKA